jgi:lycopene elongase/hydratase (dihydrobisanhydrobacterioruberin-forming)
VVSRFRRTGYRLLGSRFDYLLHTRPVEWPIVAGHATLGYILAVGFRGVAEARELGSAMLGIGLWVVALNGGTLALNSAYDRDESDVAYLRRPPPAPAHLAGFGMSLMLAGLVLAFLLPAAYRAAYGLCLILSLLYSTPPIRLKAVAGADWIINMVGFGTLTPFAGWAATGLGLTRSGGLILAGFCPLFAALYPLTQIYQFREDARRGDRTLARALGVRGSLIVSVAAAAIAFGCFSLAAKLGGWTSKDGWRWLGLALAGASWAAVLLPWIRRHRAMDDREHQRGMYYALAAWAVTDAAVGLGWGL